MLQCILKCISRCITDTHNAFEMHSRPWNALGMHSGTLQCIWKCISECMSQCITRILNAFRNAFQNVFTRNAFVNAFQMHFAIHFKKFIVVNAFWNAFRDLECIGNAFWLESVPLIPPPLPTYPAMLVRALLISSIHIWNKQPAGDRSGGGRVQLWKGDQDWFLALQ